MFFDSTEIGGAPKQKEGMVKVYFGAPIGENALTHGRDHSEVVTFEPVGQHDKIGMFCRTSELRSHFSKMRGNFSHAALAMKHWLDIFSKYLFEIGKS